MPAETPRPTTVIRVSKAARDELMAADDFLYVGRAVGRAGYRGSILANRWKGPGAVATFRLWLEGQLARAAALDWATAPRPRSALMDAHAIAVREEVRKARGRRLGCWCGDWAPGGPPLECHAVVIAQVADALPPEDAR